MHSFLKLLTTILLFYFPVLTFASDCKPPENITITDVTSSSAQVSWNAVKSGSSYQLQIIASSGKSNSLISSNNSLQLTALYPMTTYMVSIRSICGYDTSSESDVISFTTKHVSVKDSIVRGAYLQMLTENSVVIRWRTFVSENSSVRFGKTMQYGKIKEDTVNVNEHTVLLTGLQPGTKYFYTVGSTSKDKQGDEENYFITAPKTGTIQPVRIWSIGDFGTGKPPQLQVRDSYLRYTKNHPADIWIWLGDDAYSYGYDAQFTYKVFNPYKTILKHLPVFPSIGNHDYAKKGYLDSASLGTDFPYFKILDCPTQGECGGVPSKTEKYYSYNYANIHFIVLDSYGAPSDKESEMYKWLNADLKANNARWTICYFHHPPYSRGTHNSDKPGESTDIRQNIIPLLEKYKVDLVMSGHAHDYERTFLLHGHYGKQATLTQDMIVDKSDGNSPYYLKSAPAYKGTVYVVNGVGGQGGNVKTQGDWPHKAMCSYSKQHYGSMIIDVNADTLSAVFLTSTDTIFDRFKIVKSDNPKFKKNQKTGYHNLQNQNINKFNEAGRGKTGKQFSDAGRISEVEQKSFTTTYRPSVNYKMQQY